MLGDFDGRPPDPVRGEVFISRSPSLFEATEAPLSAAVPDKSSPAEYVRSIFDREMGVTLHNYRAGSARDEAMKNLTQEAVNLYAKRVLRELIQNAFDGASEAEQPRILLRLDLTAGSHGVLYVANNGRGFTHANVDAVVSPAMSNKTPGNFIGHKGLGFRSVELLSDEVQIFSVEGIAGTDRPTFDGFCFRFADAADERGWLEEAGAAHDAAAVIGRVHRLQLPVPLEAVPGDVLPYAAAGYATVIRLPLRDGAAAESAAEELRLLFDGKAPITLFLHRLAALTIESVDAEGKAARRSLSRHAKRLEIGALGDAVRIEEVTVDHKRFLVARMEAEESRFRASVEASVARRHPVERWGEWEGAPTVSIALPLTLDAESGAYYAFLPMERKAPFSGCLDAPFYPTANRRDLDLSVPLNSFLLDEVAALCVRLAEGLAESGETRSELAAAAIDAVAWTDETERLISACERVGLQVGALRLPSMRRTSVDDRWARLDEIFDWDDAAFRYLRRNLLVKVCDLPMLPARLGETRRAALHAFVEHTDFTFDPQLDNWTTWAPRIALDLSRRRKLVRSDWEAFYADLASIPHVLPFLRGEAIFRMEDGTLAPANGGADADGHELFIAVGGDNVSGRRSRIGRAARVPPSSIARKMRFADPQLRWPAATATPYFTAQLATEYSLPRVMAKLGQMLGRTPRRTTAIATVGWAFDVWKSNRTPELDDALRLASLHLPTRDGALKRPNVSWFGAGWRDTRGDLLAEFLEAAPADARTLRTLREGLLPDWDAWPLKDRGSPGEWVLFLRQLGTNDGFVPVHYKPLQAMPWDWVQFMSTDTGGPAVASTLGPWWRQALRTANPWNRFRYQSGYYEASDLYALPGQAEYGRMSNGARLAYARLIAIALADQLDSRFGSELRRTSGNSDYLSLAGPLDAFLRLAPWVPVGTGEDLQWRPPGRTWHASRTDPMPRFVPAIERSVRDLIDSSKAAQDVLISRLGMCSWHNPESARYRLEALGELLVDGLGESEYDAFRKACREAWEDWAASTPRPPLPASLTLVALSQGKPHPVPLGADECPNVFISDGADAMREQLVSALGHLVLPLPTKVADEAAKALRSRYGDNFPLLSEAELTILCDGSELELGEGAPLLAAPGREWLAEIAVLVLEFNEGLSSRNTARTRQALYEDFCRLRIRFADSVEVELDGRSGELPAILEGVLAVPDEKFPTLVVETESRDISWPLLGRISRALPLALKRPGLEMPLRVAFLEMARVHGDETNLEKPSDEEIARALGQPLVRVQEIYRALRSTSQRLFESLIPVVHVLLGSSTAETLLARQNQLVEDPQVLAVLRAGGADPAFGRRLLETCRSGETLDEVRRVLGLELTRFNEALKALGPPWSPLHFESRLRSQFDKRKEGRRAEIETRVRDAFVDLFDAGEDLALYREALTLDWAQYDDAWSDMFDQLSDEVIDARLDSALAAIIPASTAAADGPLEALRNSNRAVLVSALEGLKRLIAAWADKQDEPVAGGWAATQEEILRSVVGSGALDFRILTEADLPRALLRAGVWPASMETTTDLAALGLVQADLDHKEREDQEAQRELEKARRSVSFGDVHVDGGAERPLHLVADALQQTLASKAFAERSGKANLSPFRDGGHHGGPGSGKRRRTRDPEYMSEEQRVLIGFAGEYAAYMHLKRRVRNFSDANWVSSMGRRFLGLPPTGDDDGFDFHVPRSRGPDLYYEVKAHRGDPGYVDLERSQVSAAMSMASGRSGVWTILYVPYANSPDLISVLELQNPFAESSRNLYRETGKKAVRLEMRRLPGGS